MLNLSTKVFNENEFEYACKYASDAALLAPYGASGLQGKFSSIGIIVFPANGAAAELNIDLLLISPEFLMHSISLNVFRKFSLNQILDFLTKVESQD